MGTPDDIDDSNDLSWSFRDPNQVLQFNYEGTKIQIKTCDGAFEITHYYLSETLTLPSTLDYWKKEMEMIFLKVQGELLSGYVLSMILPLNIPIAIYDTLRGNYYLIGERNEAREFKSVPKPHPYW
jgi:hypothetical protein